MTHSRREVLAAAAGTVFASVLLPLRATAIPQLRVTGIELLPVRATSRTVWREYPYRHTKLLARAGSPLLKYGSFGQAHTGRSKPPARFFATIEFGSAPFSTHASRAASGSNESAPGPPPQ